MLPIGRGRMLREGGSVAILSLGTRLADALRAADELAARGLPATVADARFAKPLDTALVEQLARHHEVLITIEEGAVGGFGAAVLQHWRWRGLLDGGLKVRPMTLPDRFIDHDTPGGADRRGRAVGAQGHRRRRALPRTRPRQDGADRAAVPRRMMLRAARCALLVRCLLACSRPAACRRPGRCRSAADRRRSNQALLRGHEGRAAATPFAQRYDALAPGGRPRLRPAGRSCAPRSARAGRLAAADQQQQLLDVFRKFTIASYVANFDSYDGEQLERAARPAQRRRRPGGRRPRSCRRSGEPTRLDYVMRRSAGRAGRRSTCC